MSTAANQTTRVPQYRLASRLRGFFQRLLWGRCDDSSISDIRDLALEWIKMASYDFQFMGLDSDNPELLSRSIDPISRSMWSVGRQIVGRQKSEDMKMPPTEALFNAIMLERVVLHFIPSEILKYRADSIKRRFQQTVGKEAFDSYFPPSPQEKQLTTDELRAELDFIMTETMRAYMVTPLRPQSRGRLLWYCLRPFILISIFMLTISVCVTIHDSEVDQFAIIPLIPVFGAMGAMLSLQQRIENMPNKGDTVRNILALESGRETTWTTSIAGAIFAVILNLIFAGGMIEGNLFPNFHYLHHGGIISPEPGLLSDIAKMLIWAFVAGFAERMVPDTITRLTQVLQSSDFGVESRPPTSKLDELSSTGKSVGSGWLDHYPEMTIQATTGKPTFESGKISPGAITPTEQQDQPAVVPPAKLP